MSSKTIATYCSQTFSFLFLPDSLYVHLFIRTGTNVHRKEQMCCFVITAFLIFRVTLSRLNEVVSAFSRAFPVYSEFFSSEKEKFQGMIKNKCTWRENKGRKKVGGKKQANVICRKFSRHEADNKQRFWKPKKLTQKEGQSRKQCKLSFFSFPKFGNRELLYVKVAVVEIGP